MLLLLRICLEETLRRPILPAISRFILALLVICVGIVLTEIGASCHQGRFLLKWLVATLCMLESGCSIEHSLVLHLEIVLYLLAITLMTLHRLDLNLISKRRNIASICNFLVIC